MLRFLARIDRFIIIGDNIIVTNLCADKNGLCTCIFSGRKKTKEALTGQRLIEMDCILWR